MAFFPVTANGASANILQASSAYLTAFPFVTSAWITLLSVGSSQPYVFGFGTTAAGNGSSAGLRLYSNETINAASAVASLGTVEAAGPLLTPGEWTFCVARMISTTNRRLSVYQASGVITHSSSTDSSAPSSFNTMRIGNSYNNDNEQHSWRGDICEWALWNADIYDSAADLPDSLLMQLAFRGPLSLIRSLPDLLEYRSLRMPDGGSMQDGYRKQGNVVWTNVNGVLCGDRPPLPAGYVKPRAIVRTRMF